MKIGVIGFHGRMGQALQAVAPEMGVTLTEVSLSADEFSEVDAVIDFSSPEGSVDASRLAANSAKPFVSGTTGLTELQLRELHACGASCPLLHASNFSVGVNILEHLVELAARAAEGFDLEVFEAHHRHKVDSPGGTALFLGRAAARGRDLDFEEAAQYTRHGQIGPRTKDEIGFQVLRGGSIIGEHTVFLAGDGERLELTHRAQDRTIFARGAIRAALWLQGRPPGLYSMRDVLFPDPD